MNELRRLMQQPLTVSIQRQVDDTYEVTLPGGQKVPVNRKDRRAIDAESRRKKRRGHARR
jgi:hypothetical protein